MGIGRPAVLWCVVACLMVAAASGKMTPIVAAVRVSILVGADGAVKDVRKISGPQILRPGVTSIVKGWRFTPGTVNGVPTEMETPATLAVGSVAPPPFLGFLPAYPEKALKSAVSGVVQMRAVVGPDGSVTSVEIVAGPELLRQASAAAVRRWRYEPSAASGPVAVPVEIAFDHVRLSMEGGVLTVGALVAGSPPFPRPKPGMIPPRLR